MDHIFRTDEAIDEIMEEQAELSGEADFEQTVRKALALRLYLWRQFPNGEAYLTSKELTHLVELQLL